MISSKLYTVLCYLEVITAIKPFLELSLRLRYLSPGSPHEQPLQLSQVWRVPSPDVFAPSTDGQQDLDQDFRKVQSLVPSHSWMFLALFSCHYPVWGLHDTDQVFWHWTAYFVPECLVLWFNHTLRRFRTHFVWCSKAEPEQNQASMFYWSYSAPTFLSVLNYSFSRVSLGSILQQVTKIWINNIQNNKPWNEFCQVVLFMNPSQVSLIRWNEEPIVFIMHVWNPFILWLIFHVITSFLCDVNNAWDKQKVSSWTPVSLL